MTGCFMKEKENWHLLGSCVNKAEGQTCYEICSDEDFVLTYFYYLVFMCVVTNGQSFSLYIY